MLQIDVERDGGICTIACTGKITFNTTGNLRDMVRASLEVMLPHDGLILDLEGVSFIDSSGLGLLYVIKNSCGLKDINFALCGVNQQVFKILSQTNLGGYFTISKSKEDAVNVLKSRP